MFIDELLACLHLLGVHWVGLGYLWNKGFFEINDMVKGSSRGKLPILWFIENLGVFGVLWGKFLFHLLRCLGEGGGKGELPDMGMVFS